MIKTQHKINIGNSQNLNEIKNESINLVVTSPPYPMIEMWDDTFSLLNKEIKQHIENKHAKVAYNLMHEELNKVWEEIDRVMKPGGIVCINIGDATRKIGKTFQLYSNHSRIIHFFEKKGYHILPDILWRKQSNKPNKFMGSGMLPPNAYVTLEHEYILIFRKSHNRFFKTEEKENRYESAYFWEERNNWFSDVWEDVKGTSQIIKNSKTRNRNAAYPFELAYRLINMYSVKGDTVLDPFLGTGTTILAAIASERNAIGYEIDPNFKEIIIEGIKSQINWVNEFNINRLKNHLAFVKEREKPMKYKSNVYNFPVITKQEQKINLSTVKNIIYHNNEISVGYEKIPSELEKYQFESQSKLI